MAFIAKLGLSIFCGLPYAQISAPVLGAILMPVVPLSPVFIVTIVVVLIFYFINSNKTSFITRKSGSKENGRSIKRTFLFTWLFMGIILLPILFIGVKGVCVVSQSPLF